MQENQPRRPQQRSNICWYTLYITQLWPQKIESNQSYWLNYMWVEFRWDVSNYSAEIRLSLGETAACDYHVIITQRFDRAQDWAQPSPWQREGSINIRVWNSITSVNLPAFPLWEVHELLMKAQGCKFRGSETRSRPLEKATPGQLQQKSVRVTFWNWVTTSCPCVWSSYRNPSGPGIHLICSSCCCHSNWHLNEKSFSKLDL